MQNIFIMANEVYLLVLIKISSNLNVNYGIYFSYIFEVFVGVVRFKVFIYSPIF